MTPERWQRLKEVFETALERAPKERLAFLDQACDGDESLRTELQSLLASYEQGQSFMESPAVAVAAESLAGPQGESLVGQTIGHYQVTREIGSGGMGEVYLAQDTRLGRLAALKLLPTDLSKDEDRLRRFEQEARTASALNHPNVCVIYEVGETEDDGHYIAMEYIAGVTLRQHMTEARLKLGEVLDVAVQIASGLAAAHEVGIVHRDIKPENIMLRRDGYVKVLDFGLAKLSVKPLPCTDSAAPMVSRKATDPGVIMGTVQYMSPEQARGKEVDARSDIFSLGVVMYELVAGRTPFEGETSTDVLAAILDREPMPLARFSPDVPTELQRIAMKCLRKDGDDRYQTMKGLLADLRELREELAVEAKLQRSIRPTIRGGGEGQQSVVDQAEMARDQKAQTQARRAVELDPLSRIINSVYARAYLFARRYDEAITIFEKNIELNPDWYGDYEYLFYTFAAKGMFAEAVDAYVRFMILAKLAPAPEIQATQESFARSGWEGFLRHRIKYLEVGSKRQNLKLSEFYAYLGEKDKAFAYLEKACQPGHCSLELKHKSAFDNLRADPRFGELIRRDGFPQ
jgi:serine/threonine protein kinase